MRCWYQTTMYFGAAHGLAGILYVMLKVPSLIQGEIKEGIIKTIDWIINSKKENNFPVADDGQYLLMQWCHGAPGVIYMLTEAYNVMGDIKYLKEAIIVADQIWKEGILKKSVCLCHGISGNGYAFLHMYKITKREKYLIRAQHFCEACLLPKYTKKYEKTRQSFLSF